MVDQNLDALRPEEQARLTARSSYSKSHEGYARASTVGSSWIRTSRRCQVRDRKDLIWGGSSDRQIPRTLLTNERPSGAIGACSPDGVNQSENYRERQREKPCISASCRGRAGAAEMRCIPYMRIHYGLHMRAPAVEVLPVHRDQISQINLLFLIVMTVWSSGAVGRNGAPYATPLRG